MVKPTKTRKSRKKTGLAALPRIRENLEDFDPIPPTSGRRVGPPPRVPARPMPRPFRVGGGPLQDPADLRSERYAMRLHPDLRDEMTRLARMEGWKLSQWIEKALVDATNVANGKAVVDRIGRYIQKG
jgi:hypothetical protein